MTKNQLRYQVTRHAPLKFQFRGAEIRKLDAYPGPWHPGDIVPATVHRFVAINRARASFYRRAPLVCLVPGQRRDGGLNAKRRGNMSSPDPPGNRGVTGRGRW